MKKLTLSLIFILTFSIGIKAQNLTIAKALYKKAQKEYTLKNYDKVFLVIEKVKENLGGETNPEITYLEAKAHYANDITIAKAKHLFLNFLEDADPNDSRVDEVSEIIADIEISEGIDAYGQFNDVTGRTGTKKKYSNEGVLTNLYTYEKGIQEGLSKTFHSNGQEDWVQFFVNGKKNGPIKRYYKDGALKQSGNQVNGYTNGAYEWYHNNGKISFINNYDKFGRKTGEEKRYNNNGVLTGIYNYINNTLNGPYTYYNDSGSITGSGFYKNGKWDGVIKSYFWNSDKISSETSYSCEPCYDKKKSSIKEGKSNLYYKNGNILGEYYFVKGKNSGTQKTYHENGNLERLYSFNYNNKQSGETKKYYENGKLAINILYENGLPIKLIEQLDGKGKKAKVSSLKKGNGVIKELFIDGTTKSISPYTNGNLHGNQQYFYNTGAIWRNHFYENGEKTKGIIYDKSGLVNQEIEYKNGISNKAKFYYNKTRTLKQITEFDEKGSSTLVHYYNKEGKKTSTYNSNTQKTIKY